jgi:hypothetical protein
MDLEKEQFEKGFAEYRLVNESTELDLTNRLEKLFDRCKIRVNNYFLKTEPLLLQLINGGHENFYEIIELSFFQPYSYLIKSLDIRSRIEFAGFFYFGSDLNNKEYANFTNSILRELYFREVSKQNKFDLDHLLEQFEDFIYYRSVYQKTHVNVTSAVPKFKFSEEFDNILMELGLSILKDLSKKTVITIEQEEHYKLLFNSMINSIQTGFEPFENFPTAINNLFNALDSLQVISLTRKEFITQIIENKTANEVIKINLELRKSKIRTKQIGFLFFLIREKYTDNIDKTLFRNWIQQNFNIVKRDGDKLNITDNKAAADFLSQKSVLLGITSKYKEISRLVPE